MGSAYITVVLGIVLAKGIGFFREIAFSGVFGTEGYADIYFQVFNIVNLIFAGVGVALSTLVIKNMNKPHNKGHEKEYAASFIRKSFLAFTGVALLFVIFARPIITKLLLPGISAENVDLAVKQMYIMAPSIVFVVIAYIMSGVLQNEKAFFVTAIMSLPFNAVIIASLFVPGISLTAVGIVTTVGWFLHIAILLPSFLKKGYSFTKKGPSSAAQKSKNPEIVWIFISNMMFQLLFYTDRAFVSTTEGMAATFSYASNLFVIVASIFVVAMSTVFFPSISKNYEEGNIYYINDLLRYIITVMVAIFLPFLLVISLFGTNIIHLVYERGNFTAESTIQVSTILVVYSLGILGYICQELFNKILYTAGKYKYCVIGTVGVIGLNILSNFIIKTTVPDTPFLSTGVSARAFFTALSSSVLLFAYAVMIAFAIKKVVGKYWKKDLLLDLLKIFIGGIIAFGVYFVFNTFAPSFTHGKISFIIPLCVCGAVYIAFLYATGVLMRLLKRKGIN